MSLLIMGKDTATGASVEIPITDGKVDVNATVEAAEGGATEDKQDDMIAALAGGLPLALGAGGGLKVDGSGTALPVSAASLPLPTDAATQTTLAALNAKLPAAAPVADNVANPTTTLLGACVMGWNSGTNQWKRWTTDSVGIPSVIARKHPPGSRSGSTSLQIQRTIASFSCTPVVVRAYADTAGYIALFNASSAVVDGATPYGGHVRPIAAGGYVEFLFEFRETFSTGLVVAHLTQVTDGAGALATVLSTTARCMFTAQYD
jgi:hypothetical protein